MVCASAAGANAAAATVTIAAIGTALPNFVFILRSFGFVGGPLRGLELSEIREGAASRVAGERWTASYIGR